jgi:hypothetical protein
MGLKHWWKTGAAPNDYEFGLAEETFQGQRVASLRSILQPARSFGAFCQTIATEDYRGSRIRFSAALKANDVTGGWGRLWLRIDGVRPDETLPSTPWRTAPWWARLAGSSMPWCWMWRRRRPRSRLMPGCLGRGSCWCPSWPSRRSAARCAGDRRPPSPTAATEPRLQPGLAHRGRPPGRPPGTGRPDCRRRQPGEPSPASDSRDPR